METVRLDEGLRRTTAPNGLIVLTESLPGVRSAAVGIYVRTASAHERPRADGDLPSARAHGVQGHRAPYRRAARPGAGGPRRKPRRLHRPRLHQLSGARARRGSSPGGRDPHRSGPPAAAPRERPRARAERDPGGDQRGGGHARTISSSSCTPRPSGPTIPTATPSSAPPHTLADALVRRSAAAPPGRLLSAATASIAAAGNVNHEQLLTVLEREGWFEGAKAEPARLAVPARPARRGACRRETRDTAQTHIVFGTDTFPLRDPRRFPLAILTNVFGGGMSSRLFQRVREELGLAYCDLRLQALLPEHRAAGRLRRHPVGQRADRRSRRSARSTTCWRGKACRRRSWPTGSSS